MSSIRGRDTKPELTVRRIVHRLGFRYRLHAKTLPGRPDLVLARHRKVIFVHGCFWHSHDCRYGAVTPATRAEFWQNKRATNAARDDRNLRELSRLGWQVLIVWECWLRDRPKVETLLKAFLVDGNDK